MNISLKLELLIRLFCIIILITLIVLVYLNGIKLECNKCEINFKSIDSISKQQNNFSIKITDLFDEFNNGSCLVKYDNGFYITKFK